MPKSGKEEEEASTRGYKLIREMLNHNTKGAFEHSFTGPRVSLFIIAMLEGVCALKRRSGVFKLPQTTLSTRRS